MMARMSTFARRGVPFGALCLFFALSPSAYAQNRIPDLYDKQEYDIPMRDGVTLHTVVYIPKSTAEKHPILMERTPYSAGPYGPGRFGGFRGSPKLREKGYIFAFQDVRGQYLSTGTYVNIRPELKSDKVNESTDTYDTVDWMVKHVPNNNGCVGLWGISYPGFYAGAGGINSHPALKAISPQAPVSNWFKGDDVHHNGAFFVQDNFDFSSSFDYPHAAPETMHRGLPINKEGKNAYDFFLGARTDEGLEKLYYKGAIPYWNELLDHPNYDQYWKDRSLPDHFTGVKCAVLTVGGLFDAEDMWGALNLYKAGEKKNKGTPNFLVMGPWYHGMWAAPNGTTFGDLNFGINTSEWYRENVEFPFFEKYLRGQNVPPPAEATIFETGSNKWMTFEQWPPKGLGKAIVYLAGGKGLALEKPGESAPDSYVNDPAAPTPYLADYKTNQRRTRTYMIDDQRWAEARPDVATYKGPVLSDDLTVAGPVDVDFWVSTTGTDGDFVVKVIDVWPDDAPEKTMRGESMAGYEQNVRADIMRGRFRDSLEHAKPFIPGQPTRLHFQLNDMLHTFKKGHRVMVQVQSSWFPLVDQNPNAFVDIYHAKPEQYQKATISIYHDPKHPSHLTFGTLK